MAKRAFWKADWFFGVLISIVFVFSLGADWLQGIERWTYDLGVRSTDRQPADNIAVIAIDDESIANLGRWPWPRNVHAEVIAALHQAGAKVVGPAILFSEPQQDPGSQSLNEIYALYSQSSLAERLPEDIAELNALMGQLNNEAGALTSDVKYDRLREQIRDTLTFYFKSSLRKDVPGDSDRLVQAFQQASQALDQDAVLAGAISGAGNVVLPMVFELGLPQGNPDSALPDYLLRNRIDNVLDEIGAKSAGLNPVLAVDAIAPIEKLGAPAGGIAHLNQTLDIDGGIRSEPLIVDYYDDYFPSMSLMLAAKSLNLTPADIQIQLGEGVRLKNLQISTDSALRMNTFFYQNKADGSPAFPVDSFFDVKSGKIPFSKYKGKIVLIGPTAAGISTPQKTPVDEAMHPALTLAHSVSSILKEDFFISPAWAGMTSFGLLLLVAMYLIVLLPRLKAMLAAILTVALALGLFAGELFLMTAKTTWVPLMAPLLLLVLGHMLLTTKRFLWTERSKEALTADSSETNRMLGIAFQGQGQLDQAFEKFRKCEQNETVLDNLYNLALDYERKRQFNKAGMVYRHIASTDPKFRDVGTRLTRAEQLENTMVIGGGSTPTNAATMLLDGDQLEKPMLGRYQVEKELGKGAMGMVYLGVDPKIDRKVAIKTMALSQEFEGAELDEAKERFFREAKSAGRLNHPNIVTIYDTGDEHDLAYIAMELLKGEDLDPFITADNLLPISEVMSIVAKVADGLHYAHLQNIVHRDIKPANIMYEPDTRTVKITDFGIARITDSSRTKTGMVLGTPSYMSPEQLQGKHVDGRSDLFSLGVMLYQLLTGQLPFVGDSLATLMFKIANDEPADIRTLRPDLPVCLVEIVNKCLLKTVEARYQTGEEIKKALDLCAITVEKTGGI